MALGPLWIIITPVVNMVIFTLIFGGLAKLPSEGVPYPIFTYVAILPWTYFSRALTVSAASLRSGMGLISKVYFPRAIMPMSGVVGGLADFGMGILVLLCLLAYYRIMPGIAAVLLPLYLLLAMVTALSLGLWVSAIQVRYRDIGNLITYGLQTWMYLTPVAYAASLIPDRFQLVYQLNPMYWVIEGFRWGLIGTGSGPQPLMLAPVGAVALMLVSGAFIFRRTERTVVDLL
jgi:lipopolysaccharide transport system permease protein